MTAKKAPLSRQELMQLLVTDADAFTALRYLRHRENVPALPELEEAGAQTLPGTHGVLADLYHTLWDPEPSVKDKDDVPPDRKYWHQLLGQALTSSAYQELHAATQLQELQSILGTIAMGESVLALVPKEDREKLEELSQSQSDADEMQQQADTANAQATMLQQLADQATANLSSDGSGQEGQPGQPQAQGSPSGQPAPGATPGSTPGTPQQGKSSGKPGGVASGTGRMTADQAQQIADQLAQAAADAKAEAQTAQELSDEARTATEKLADQLLGKPGSEQASDKLRELARIGLQALRDAQAKVEEISETIQAWGLEPGELTRQPIPEALALLGRMRRNQHFQRFAALLGRVRKIAARKARSKVKGEGVRITVTETGRDIKRAHTSELIALTQPGLRTKALTRWARGELRLKGQQTKHKLGHGPMIVCEDGSGSMDGAKQQWAKAVSLSLAHYAKLQKRSFGWILFDSGVRQSRVCPNGRLTPEQMLELVESRAGGGTDFEKPLHKAMEMIQNQGLKKADICFLTDGECAVSQQFLAEFLAFKQRFEVSVIAVLCDVGSTSDATVRKFADRVLRASSFTAEEAESLVFNSL